MTTDAITIWPCLNYRDARRAIRFLVDALGFREGAVHATGHDGEHVHHAELRWPEGGGVMLGSAKSDGTAFEQLPTGSSGLYVVTSNPEEVYQRALADGAEVVTAPRDREHDGRDFTIRDPERNVWSFGTYRGGGTADGTR